MTTLIGVKTVRDANASDSSSSSSCLDIKGGPFPSSEVTLPSFCVDFEANKDTTMGKKSKYAIKQSVLKEIQDCCFAVGLDAVYAKDRMSNTAKKQALYDLVHGNPNDADSMGLLEKMANGIGEFSCLFEPVEVDGNDGTTSPKLKLRDCLLKDPMSPPIILKRDITHHLLQLKTKNSTILLSKEAMWLRGVQLFREGKKALAFSKDPEVYDSNRPPDFFPSGKNITDWEHHVLSKVNALKGEPATVTPPKEHVDVEDEEDQEAEERRREEDDYIKPFDGWMAFRAFGPRPLGNTQLTRLYEVGENLDGIYKELNRKTARKLKKQERDSNRELEHAVSVDDAMAGGGRGVSAKNQMKVAFLAAENARAVERAAEHENNRMMFKIDQKQRELDRQLRLACNMAGGDSSHPSWKEYDRLKCQLDAMNRHYDLVTKNNSPPGTRKYVAKFVNQYVEAGANSVVSVGDNNVVVSGRNKNIRRQLTYSPDDGVVPSNSSDSVNSQNNNVEVPESST